MMFHWELLLHFAFFLIAISVRIGVCVGTLKIWFLVFLYTVLELTFHGFVQSLGHLYH